MSNLDIWNSLGKTDPGQTKPFTRGGGFKGTAVKPVYTEQKMTEQFGPAGTGWGVSEPTFQLVPGSDGQTAVYCWLTLWYVHDGKRSEGIPGVGGDFVVVKQSGGLRTDDEAFKKAFTDAIGNAMKHLGMSADVHMGRFDDSKYVQERREEEAEAKAPTDRPARTAPKAVETPFDEAVADSVSTIVETMIDLIHSMETKADLDRWYLSQNQAIRDLPKMQRNQVIDAMNTYAAKFNVMRAG